MLNESERYRVTTRGLQLLMEFWITLSSGVTRALIGGGGGGVYSYIRVLPDGFLLKSDFF